MSSQLDTNGQNARYVRAARRHGHEQEIIRILAVGHADPAGVVGRYKRAADKLGTLEIREAHKATAYMDFPVDIVWNNRTNDREVRDLARKADIIHLNNSYRPLRALGIGPKPTLLHHHGSLFRKDPGHMLAWARAKAAVSAVSTIDLLRPAPRTLHWLPTAYDLDELAQHRARRDDGMVRIVSCPTNRSYKSTAVLDAAVRDLRAEGLPVELELVEGRPWAESLAAKGRADIYFDQVAAPGAMPGGGDYPGGYGCNAIEAWAMGVPVIAGADEWTTAEMTSRWGALPYYHATQATLRDAVRALVESADLRAEWGARGRAHADTYHAERPALERLAELYALTLQTWSPRPGRQRLEDPVRFRNDGSALRRVYGMDDNIVELPAGAEIDVDDPAAMLLLRRLSKRRSSGVSEVVA